MFRSFIGILYNFIFVCLFILKWNRKEKREEEEEIMIILLMYFFLLYIYIFFYLCLSQNDRIVSVSKNSLIDNFFSVSRVLCLQFRLFFLFFFLLHFALRMSIFFSPFSSSLISDFSSVPLYSSFPRHLIFPSSFFPSLPNFFLFFLFSSTQGKLHSFSCFLSVLPLFYFFSRASLLTFFYSLFSF